MVFRYRERSHSVPSNDFLIPEYLRFSKKAVKALRIGGNISRHSLYVFVANNEGLKAVFTYISLVGI